ncbi:hypothetical protein AB833_22310 [Chromatiales bacterium (ex Bugula neritina AB1)]|nr:hypothetical protein AB833_22310 [Chromatiales bacterium (ex Bugula neritina AB1)]
MFMKLTTRSSRIAITCLLLSGLLQGCASTKLKQVHRADRAISGAFDGTWKGEVISTAATQPGPGDWVMNCGDLSGTEIGQIAVVDGVANFGPHSESSTAYVNESGKFRFVIPMAEVATASGRSDSSISNGKMTFIMYGSLQSQRGTMVYGIAQFGNNGCASKVKFTRV